jgi:transposase
MKPYSTDLRERLVRARDAGLPRTEVVRLFGVSASSITRWQAKAKRGEAVAARPRPGRPPKIGPALWPALQAQVAAHPDATLFEHCQRWEQEQGITVSEATMSRLLTKLKLPLKKRR